VLRGGALVLAYGGSFSGGYEGGNPAPGATSGDGARIEPSGGDLWLRGATLVPGPVNAPGTAGQPLALLGGSSTSFAAGTQMVSDGFQPLYREGDPMQLFVIGAPGDVVALLVAVEGGFVPLQARQGVLGVSPSLFLGPLALGVANASGLVSVPAVAPNLPPGLDSLIVFTQALNLNAPGTVLGPARTIILLDASL
jgi:hypothetical protein